MVSRDYETYLRVYQLQRRLLVKWKTDALSSPPADDATDSKRYRITYKYMEAATFLVLAQYSLVLVPSKF